MKIFFSTVFLLVFFLLPRIAHAQENWIINKFHSDITVQEDGHVKVVETINLNFGSLEKHGIFRDIPIEYTDGVYTDINVVSIERNGKAEPFEESRNSYLNLKIGDADVTIDGEQTYKISYVVTGVLKRFNDHDELYWNGTGNGWPVPIASAAASVRLPENTSIQTACYQGYEGSTETCNSRSENNVAQFSSTRPLELGEGMTIVAGWEKGLVPILAVEKPKKVYDYFLSTQYAVVLLVSLFIGLGGAILLWWKKGRDSWFRKQHLFDPDAKEEIKPRGSYEPIIVEYTPPDNLRPAEIGVLMDERADTLDVTATIIDLAVRGYLKIKELDKHWLFGSVDYELTQLKKDKKGLLPYEKELLDRLFDDGTTVKMSGLKKKFYKDLLEVKKQLYKDMVDKKFFPSNPERVRNTYLGISIVIIILAGTGFGLSVAAPGFLWPLNAAAIGLGLYGLVLLVVSRSMSKRSAHGREMYRRARGYELFISNVERHRQQFFENKNMFNEVLPYAIVLGLTEKLAKAFEKMGIKPPDPTWYAGTHAFNASTFQSNINGFSNSMSRSIASSPSSSGFSGGGSSGGGFGGGGGGSW